MSDWKSKSPFLVFQIFIPTGKDFSIEIEVVDNSNICRKLIFTYCRGMVKNSMSVRVSHGIFEREKWLNLLIDLPAFVQECWRSYFKSIGDVSILGNCKIRRITAASEYLPSHQIVSPASVNSKRDRFLKHQSTIVLRKIPKHKLSPMTFKDKPIFNNENSPSLPRVRNARRNNPFLQEIRVAPEPMLKAPMPGYFEKNFISLTKIRHNTPPLVNDGLVYDPVSRHYRAFK